MEPLVSDQKTQTDEIKVEGREVAYRFLTTFEELKKTGQLTRWVDDHDILLYEHDGQIKALSDICRHFGGPVGFHKAKNGELSDSGTVRDTRARDGFCLSHRLCPRGNTS
jgi:nitrite reductase/ring-hydroxylating ferredoxin subunit